MTLVLFCYECCVFNTDTTGTTTHEAHYVSVMTFSVAYSVLKLGSQLVISHHTKTVFSVEKPEGFALKIVAFFIFHVIISTRVAVWFLLFVERLSGSKLTCSFTSSNADNCCPLLSITLKISCTAATGANTTWDVPHYLLLFLFPVFPTSVCRAQAEMIPFMVISDSVTPGGQRVP